MQKLFITALFSYAAYIGATEAAERANATRSADSFSFGVEREMKESGEKGGTQDMNIGIGELQECTVSNSMETASAHCANTTENSKGGK